MGYSPFLPMSNDPKFHKQNTLPGFALEPSSQVDITSPPSATGSMGRYKVEGVLSQGGMSHLYLGFDTEKKEPVAIKVLLPRYLAYPELKQQFLKEAHIIGLTQHPNIVKLYDQGEDEKGVYIVMEFIRGVSLRQFILHPSLSFRRSLEIILQVAYALLHLHSHGVIHRDLKPENILISESGDVKVVDFGIAQLQGDMEEVALALESSSSLLKGPLGTPHYMSPEQKTSPHTLSFASDIYSLGVVAYELILGEFSYGMINLSLIPEKLQKILSVCLAIDPNKRYQDIVDFIADLTEYLKSEESIERYSEGDQLKELIEVIRRSQLKLVPSGIPRWDPIEMGFVQSQELKACGIYVDFFKLPKNLYGVFLAEAIRPEIHSLFELGMLKGMVQALLQSKRHFEQDLLKILPFMEDLNHLIITHLDNIQFSSSFLLLDPLRDFLYLVSTGFQHVLHLSARTTKPRVLESSSAWLGSERSIPFEETRDSWQIGDQLLFHSLQRKIEEEQKIPEKKISDLLETQFASSSAFSRQKQAESIYRTLNTSLPSPELSSLKFVLTIERIA